MGKPNVYKPRIALAGKRFAAALVLSMALTLNSAPSLAQLEHGVMGLFQNGKEVGRIYVPARHSHDDTYVEYWFLYPNYVYPGKDLPGFETVIVPLAEKFSSLAAFRNSMQFEPGTRSIKVLSHETLTQ